MQDVNLCCDWCKPPLSKQFLSIAYLSISTSSVIYLQSEEQQGSAEEQIKELMNQIQEKESEIHRVRT